MVGKEGERKSKIGKEVVGKEGEWKSQIGKERVRKGRGKGVKDWEGGGREGRKVGGSQRLGRGGKEREVKQKYYSLSSIFPPTVFTGPLFLPKNKSHLTKIMILYTSTYSGHHFS